MAHPGRHCRSPGRETLACGDAGMPSGTAHQRPLAYRRRSRNTTTDRVALPDVGVGLPGS